MTPIRYARAKELIEAELGEEMVALDVEGGQCFGFNQVAADIWRLLDQPKNFETLHQSLMDAYEVDADECAADLRSCLAEMEGNDLIHSVKGRESRQCRIVQPSASLL
jgi:hypothetical protein